MKFSSLLVLLLVVSTCLQAQDRGCPGNTEYLSISTSDTNYVKNEWNLGWSTPHWMSHQDTIVVEAPIGSEVEINWGYADRHNGRYSRMIDWQRNQVPLDTSFFEFIIDSLGSECNSPVGNQTTLKTTKDGIYRFTLRNYNYGSPFFKIVRTEATDTLTEIGLIRTPAILIYPNPSSSRLHVEHGTIENGSISFFDLQGKAVTNLVLDVKESVSIFGLTELPSGYYLIKLTTDVHGTITKKISVVK